MLLQSWGEHGRITFLLATKEPFLALGKTPCVRGSVGDGDCWGRGIGIIVLVGIIRIVIGWHLCTITVISIITIIIITR